MNTTTAMVGSNNVVRDLFFSKNSGDAAGQFVCLVLNTVTNLFSVYTADQSDVTSWTLRETFSTTAFSAYGSPKHTLDGSDLD